MIILGTVKSIDLNTTAKGKNGDYPCWELIYKNSHGEVKTMVKHLNGLKYNKPLANGLAELSQGDKFTLEQEKNASDFWEPKVIYKGHKEDTPSTPPASSTKAASGGGNTTFEVGNQLKAQQQVLDEKRQPLIVRQTCLTATANLASVLKLKTEADILAQAKRFEAFIYGDDGGLENMANDDIEVT